MELNTQQKTAAEYSSGHVLVLAGAGTGKTNTIIARAAHLIQSGVDPKRILMLTFTRRAAREMTARLSRMIHKDTSELMAGTFHHFCLYSMRRMPKVFGIEQSTVIDRDDQMHLMKIVRSVFVSKGEQFPKAESIVDLYSYARNTNQSPRKYLKKFTEHDDKTIDTLLKAFAEYDTRKKSHNYLDYDDILFLFAKRLHEDAAVRDRLKSLYDHILVDEMQDTNPLQWLILDGLRDPAKLFCVGDDAQSIYAFRGADFRNVHSFTKRVPESNVLRLEENYRSTQRILDLANWLLKQSPLKYNKRLKAHRGEGNKPRLIDCESDLHEAKWITDDLIERHENGAVWKDHMVITRTAFAARALEAALIEKKIPYRFIGGTTLIQAAHIKDLFSLIRAAASHVDQIAWIRYLTLFPGIGDVKAGRIISDMGRRPTPPLALKSISDNRFVMPDVRDKVIEGIALVLNTWNKPSKAIEAAADFLDPLLRDRYERWDMRGKDYSLLVRLAKNYKSLMSFIETFTLDPISTTEAERLELEDFVTLITVHSAKGTEARICYLLQVQPSMYPHIKSIGKVDEEEEERRVLYVAMTRAKDELIITRTLTRKGQYTFHGGTTVYPATGRTVYFLEDLPDNLIEQEVTGFNTDRFSDYDDYVIKPWNKK